MFFVGLRWTFGTRVLSVNNRLNYHTPSCTLAHAYAHLPYSSPKNTQGFEDEAVDFEADSASLEIEETYPYCKVLPTSKLTVDQAGVDSGDITNFQASLFVRLEARR